MSAVIFDLDGTLVDTLADIAGAMNAALARDGLGPWPVVHYRRLVGEGVERLVEKLLGGAEGGPVLAAPAVRARAAAGYRELYPGRMLAESQPYPGIVPLLDALAARGIPLAVLSNKPHADTQAMVAALFPGRFPEALVLGQRADRPRKPDPTEALGLAAALGVAPERCLFVGDTPIDVRTARAAGMVPLGVAWGFRPAEELRAEGARIVAEPAEILAHLG